MSQRLLGVVLCGGKSTRMGQEKAALPHPKFATYLEHAIAELTPLCDQVVVSGTTSVSHDLVELEDSVKHQGPIHGIAAALRYAIEHGFAACLVTAVDMPYLHSDDLRHLVAAWATDNKTTVARSSQIEPLAAIYPVAVQPEMETNIALGRRSLTRWLEATPHHAVALSEQSCRNINTPDDLNPSTSHGY
ncbi:molybdenum cofactor guanylyltransferase [Rubripirellula amarantea]|nr:molybdenum cofactor guanylyltransferase [Rubripirellula amarantea]